jgi:hypothetical protein
MLDKRFEIHDYSQFTIAKESDSCRVTVALVQEVGRPPLKLVQSKVLFLLLFSLVLGRFMFRFCKRKKPSNKTRITLIDTIILINKELSTFTLR